MTRKTALSPLMSAHSAPSSAVALRDLFEQRIAVLDGAMGSMIQTYKLEESDFRGTRFRDHPHDLKGNNDLLNLTRPDVIEEIHAAYFAAGADMVETNTFSSTVIAQADYQLESAVRDLNLAAVAIARRAAQKAIAQARGVAEQLAQGDGGVAAVRLAWLELRQPARDGLVQAEATLGDQGQGGDRGDRLGHRGQAKQRIDRHCLSRFPVGQAGGPAIDDATVTGHQDHRAHQALVGDGAVQDSVDPRLDRVDGDGAG